MAKSRKIQKDPFYNALVKAIGKLFGELILTAAGFGAVLFIFLVSKYYIYNPPPNKILLIVGYSFFAILTTIAIIILIYIWAKYEKERGTHSAKKLLEKQPFKAIDDFDKKQIEKETAS